MGVAPFTGIANAILEIKFVILAKKKRGGHKYTNCKQKWRKKSFVKVTKPNEPEIENIRKYVEVTINRKIKLQLDSGSDLSILSLQTWKRIGKPTMMKTTKSARSVTGDKIKFGGKPITNIMFKGKTLKSKVYITNTNNLFGSDLIEILGYGICH